MSRLTSNNAWICQSLLGTCQSTPISFTIQLACPPGIQQWGLTVQGLPNLYHPTSSSCAPFALVFTGVDLTGCGGTASATVTVTPWNPVATTS